MSEHQTLSPTKNSGGGKAVGVDDPPAPLVEQGEWARDVERDDSTPVLVLAHTLKPCDEEVIHETPPADDDITVATYNAKLGYSPTEPVSCGVYRNSLDDAYGGRNGWSVEQVMAAAKVEVLPDEKAEALPDVRIYSFPRTRLREAESATGE